MRENKGTNQSQNTDTLVKEQKNGTLEKESK